MSYFNNTQSSNLVKPSQPPYKNGEVAKSQRNLQTRTTQYIFKKPTTTISKINSIQSIPAKFNKSAVGNKDISNLGVKTLNSTSQLTKTMMNSESKINEQPGSHNKPKIKADVSPI